MHTASPVRFRERRTAVMLREAQAASPGKRSLLIRVAPVLTVICGLAVFLVLSWRERVLPEAAVRQVAATPAPVVAAPPPPALQQHVERQSLRLKRSRRFTEMNGLSVRLVNTKARNRRCDIDVRTGSAGYRRLRVHAGERAEVPGTSGQLAIQVDAISAGQVRGSVESATNLPSPAKQP